MSIFSWLKSTFFSPSPTTVQREAPYRQVPEGFRPAELLIRVHRGTDPGSAHTEMESRSHPSRQGTDETVVVLIKELTKAEITQMGGRLTDRTLAQWGLARGWIVADGKEMKAIGADPQTRDLQREGPLVGCGTIAPHDGDAYVWAVGGRSDTGEPYLVSIFGLGDYRLYCHAFVRKAPAQSIS